MVRALVKTLPGKIYEDADHSIGTVGSAGQLATYGNLIASDFPGASGLSSFYSLNSAGTDLSANSKNFTAGGSTPTFVSVGFFGNENIYKGNSSNDRLARTGDSAFNINLATQAISFGGWFYSDNWASQPASTILMGIGQNNGCMLQVGGTDMRLVMYSGAASTGTPKATLGSGWKHFVGVVNAGATKFFVDGQLAATNTGMTGTTSTSDFYIGNDYLFASASLAPMQQLFITFQALTDTQVNNIYSKRFKGQQLAGGHPLTADSFPLSSLSNKTAFFNLSNTSTSTDGSVNAKNLTDEGGIFPATGLNIFGAATTASFNGTTQNLSSTDNFFNPGPGHSFGYGGWFAASDWSPGGTRYLITNFPADSSDQGYRMQVAGGIIQADYSTGPATTIALGSPNMNWIDGSWHHIFIFYDFVNQVQKIYADGVQVASGVFTNQRTITNSKFRIGAHFTSPLLFFQGRAQDVCFFKDMQVTEADIQKLMAARVDLSTTTTPADQNWTATYISEDGLIKSDLNGSSFIVDKDNTKAWIDFGGSAAFRVNLRMNQA